MSKVRTRAQADDLAAKGERAQICSGCGIGLNIDTSRFAKATEEIQKAIDKMPPEISIKFFR